MRSINFLLAGVGGQGTILASDVLAAVGLRSGHDVKKSEVHGMKGTVAMLNDMGEVLAKAGEAVAVLKGILQQFVEDQRTGSRLLTGQVYVGTAQLEAYHFLLVHHPLAQLVENPSAQVFDIDHT